MPRPDFTREAAVVVKGDEIVTASVGVVAAAEGLTTCTMYSLVAPTVMPPSNPPKAIVWALEAVVAEVVKSSAPLVTSSPWVDPVTVVLPAVSRFRLMTTAFTWVAAIPVRSAARLSRTLDVVPEAANVLYSVVKLSGRRPKPLM